MYPQQPAGGLSFGYHKWIFQTSFSTQCYRDSHFSSILFSEYILLLLLNGVHRKESKIMKCLRGHEHQDQPSIWATQYFWFLRFIFVSFGIRHSSDPWKWWNFIKWNGEILHAKNGSGIHSICTEHFCVECFRAFGSILIDCIGSAHIPNVPCGRWKRKHSWDRRAWTVIIIFRSYQPCGYRYICMCAMCTTIYHCPVHGNARSAIESITFASLHFEYI